MRRRVVIKWRAVWLVCCSRIIWRCHHKLRVHARAASRHRPSKRQPASVLLLRCQSGSRLASKIDLSCRRHQVLSHLCVLAETDLLQRLSSAFTAGVPRQLSLWPPETDFRPLASSVSAPCGERDWPRSKGAAWGHVQTGSRLCHADASDSRVVATKPSATALWRCLLSGATRPELVPSAVFATTPASWQVQGVCVCRPAS